MIYFPPYANKCGISNIGLGSILSVYNIISLIFMIPFGILTDKFGSKKIMNAGVVLLIIWVILVAFCSDFYCFLAGYFFGGIGTVLFLISLNSAFYSSINISNSKKYITYFYTASTLGFMLGPFIGSYLVKYLKYETAFKIDILNLLFMLALIVKTEMPKQLYFRFSDYLKDFNLKTFILILLTIIFYSHYGTEQTSYTLLMQKKLDFSDLQVGNVFVVLGLWISIVTLIVGKLSKAKYLILIYCFGVMTSGLFQFATGLSNNYFDFLIYRVLHTLGDAICMLMLGLIVSLVFDKSRMGFSFGFFLMAQLIASIPFSYISGILSRNGNYSTPFFF
ncbi:MAG TPA: MFS transporter, partial [bacterium]|nr:MFS transporter [bacterium]